MTESEWKILYRIWLVLEAEAHAQADVLFDLLTARDGWESLVPVREGK